VKRPFKQLSGFLIHHNDLPDRTPGEILFSAAYRLGSAMQLTWNKPTQSLRRSTPPQSPLHFWTNDQLPGFDSPHIDSRSSRWKNPGTRCNDHLFTGGTSRLQGYEEIINTTILPQYCNASTCYPADRRINMYWSAERQDHDAGL
jgi:hypothetical protein